MAASNVQYFPSGMARMTTRRGVNVRLTGVRKTTKNLRLKLRQIRGVTIGGLINAGVIIKESMDTKPPLIPIDTGALRESFRIIPQNDPVQPKIKLGWPDETITRKDPDTGEIATVDQYAAFVHEMTSPPYGAVKWSRPQSGPKFLEAAVKNNTKEIMAAVAAHVKGKTGI